MFDVGIETGSKKVFASALDWPGWSRGARTEDDALAALIAYGARYAAALRDVRGFKAPKTAAHLRVVERLKGNASTDFGVPDLPAAADHRPVDGRERARLKKILSACWATFDEVAERARGKELSTGPRGGGRDLEKIRAHVLDGERSYRRGLGAGPLEVPPDVSEALALVHDAFLDALDDRLDGKVPDRGPRGGVRRVGRYAVRRAAWHVLDHAWEIEDRVI